MNAQITIEPLPAREAARIERKVWAAIGAGYRAPILDLFMRAYATRKARGPGRPRRNTSRDELITACYRRMIELGEKPTATVGQLAESFNLDDRTVRGIVHRE